MFKMARLNSSAPTWSEPVAGGTAQLDAPLASGYFPIPGMDLRSGVAPLEVRLRLPNLSQGTANTVSWPPRDV
jgi:hypothetical protein